MPYSSTSTTFKIPYMSQGERSSGASNRRAVNIIDAQLSGVTRLSSSTGIINEGTYSTGFSSNDSEVTLMGSGPDYALECFINQIYIAQNTVLVWTGLPNNATIYLYAQTQETAIYQSGEFSSLATKQAAPVWSTTGSTPANSILLAIATTTGSSISVSTDSSISDSSFAQRPLLVPFGDHRTLNPIDHPYDSIQNAHLQDDTVGTRNIQSWDGNTSGPLLVGGGIGPLQIKPKAVTSRALDASLSTSGLEVQESFTVLSPAPSVFRGSTQFSGTTTSIGFTGQNLAELVPLRYFQTSQSGLASIVNTVVNSATASLPVHRLLNPIDHPVGSIQHQHLSENVIKTINLHPWDGVSVGNSSGTGINSSHIKPKAVNSQALDAFLSTSGLEIQDSFATLHSATATLSGTTLVPGYRGVDILEAVPLQILQQVSSGLQTGVDVLTSTSSGITNQFSSLQKGVLRGISNISSGTGSLQVLYPLPFTTNPSVAAAIHTTNTDLPTVTFTGLTSGSSGGFVGLWSGVPVDSSIYTLHWNAGT